MTTPPTIPIGDQAHPPQWTVRRAGPPTAEGIRALARLCLEIARQRLAERVAAGGPGATADGQEHHGGQDA